MRNIKKYVLLTFLIVIFIIGLVLFTMKIRKNYIISNNSYSKYEKCVVAEVVDYKINKFQIYAGGRGRKTSPQYTITYTFYVESTGQTIKLKEKMQGAVSYQKGTKQLLIYYNIYEKNTNKLLEEKFYPKVLSYFEDGNFFGFLDNSYIYYHNRYENKAINFVLDYKPDYQDENQLWFDDSNYNLCILSKELNQDVITTIETRTQQKSKIEIIETNLGTVYNFYIDSDHYSVLNYGDTLNDSIVLSVCDRNILDFISNAEIYAVQNYN